MTQKRQTRARAHTHTHTTHTHTHTHTHTPGSDEEPRSKRRKQTRFFWLDFWPCQQRMLCQPSLGAAFACLCQSMSNAHAGVHASVCVYLTRPCFRWFDVKQINLPRTKIPNLHRFIIRSCIYPCAVLFVANVVDITGVAINAMFLHMSMD